MRLSGISDHGADGLISQLLKVAMNDHCHKSAPVLIYVSQCLQTSAIQRVFVHAHFSYKRCHAAMKCNGNNKAIYCSILLIGKCTYKMIIIRWINIFFISVESTLMLYGVILHISESLSGAKMSAGSHDQNAAS